LDGLDNPAAGWRERTAKKNEDGYGRYLAWLHRNGMFSESDPVCARITPDKAADYARYLKSHFSSVSVATTMGALTSAARALAPEADWSWLSRRSTRLKGRAKPSRAKRHIVQHTLDLFCFGKGLMDGAEQGRGGRLAAAQRFQAGLIIALLAARPLRIRNFQAITIGQSLRWDGTGYWLTFSADETKTGGAIDEPIPADLIPYLEAYLRLWRPIILRQADKYDGLKTHGRLWVDIFGRPMQEFTLRELIKRYTRKRFGTALWPHLFRDCLLTSVAIDQPDLIRISGTLLGHTNLHTGEKHYNQARMLDASRRFGDMVSGLRDSFDTEPQPAASGRDGNAHRPCAIKCKSRGALDRG
jgi:integrase/recombinase XerD